MGWTRRRPAAALLLLVGLTGPGCGENEGPIEPGVPTTLRLHACRGEAAVAPLQATPVADSGFAGAAVEPAERVQQGDQILDFKIVTTEHFRIIAHAGLDAADVDCMATAAEEALHFLRAQYELGDQEVERLQRRWVLLPPDIEKIEAALIAAAIDPSLAAQGGFASDQGIYLWPQQGLRYVEGLGTATHELTHQVQRLFHDIPGEREAPNLMVEGEAAAMGALAKEAVRSGSSYGDWEYDLERIATSLDLGTDVDELLHDVMPHLHSNELNLFAFAARGTTPLDWARVHRNHELVGLEQRWQAEIGRPFFEETLAELAADPDELRRRALRPHGTATEPSSAISYMTYFPTSNGEILGLPCLDAVVQGFTPFDILQVRIESPGFSLIASGLQADYRGSAAYSSCSGIDGKGPQSIVFDDGKTEVGVSATPAGGTR